MTLPFKLDLKPQRLGITGHTIKLWLVLILLASGSLACRLEVGFSPANAAQEQPDSAAVVSAPPPANNQPAADAASSIQPEPAEAIVPEQEVVAETPVAAEPDSVVETSSSETENNPEAAPVKPAASPTPIPTPTPVIPANAPPSHISIPSINLDTAIDLTTWEVNEQDGSQTSTWLIPDHAPGWHVNSALPGHGSNVVLSGHHNIGDEVFKNLVNVNPGDALTLQADGRDYQYTITDRFIVPERDVPQEQQIQNAQWILPTVDERVTLVTCWPYHDNSHRVIVIAKPANS